MMILKVTVTFLYILLRADKDIVKRVIVWSSLNYCTAIMSVFTK